MERLTVCTPTYNREHTLHRVFESLNKQTFKDFVWIVIDDGSVDNTKELIYEYKKKADYNIEYEYQENQGKHVAVNKALRMANTELFIIADSDDAFDQDAFEKLISAWDRIEDNEKDKYNGVICRVYDHITKQPIGSFPEKFFISDSIEAYFKLKLRFEKWQLFSAKAFKEFPFHEEKGLKFFPETVIWQEMATKYKTVYIDDALREYYRDQSNSIINKKDNSKENIWLWKHWVNNINYRTFLYHPNAFLRAFIGLSMDGIKNGYSIKKILSIPNKISKKIIVFLFIPLGYIFCRIKYKNINKQ